MWKNNTPLNIHGHHHEDMSGVLENGTNVVGCYKAKILDISPNGIIVSWTPLQIYYDKYKEGDEKYTHRLSCF